MSNRLFYLVMAFSIGFVAHVGSLLAAPRVRFNLDTTLFSFNRTIVEDDNSKTNFTSFGMGQSQGWGSAYAPTFGFGLGFLPIDNLTLGMKIGAGGGQYEIENPGVQDNPFNNDWKFTYNILSYRFLPFVEYKFDLGKVQPFVMATVGYRGGVMWNDEYDDLKQKNHLFAYGGGAGVHFFPIDTLSIDVGLDAMGGVGKTIAEVDDGTTKTERKVDLRDVNLSANLGLTGWF